MIKDTLPAILIHPPRHLTITAGSIFSEEMVIIRQVFLLTLLTQLAVIASGGAKQKRALIGDAPSDPAPISGALYLDPWQIEKEFLLTPMALQGWYDLGLTSDVALSPERRSLLKLVIGKFLASRCPVSIRDEPVAFTLDRIHFIQPDASEFRPVSGDETVPAGDMWISVVFSAPQTDPRQALQLMWDLIPEGPEPVTIKVADPEGTRNFELNRLSPSLNVRGRFDPNARTPPPPAPIINPNPSRPLALPWISILILLTALFGFLALRRDPRRRILGMCIIASAALAATLTRGISIEFSPKKPLTVTSNPEAIEILNPLLRRIYHAFNYRSQDQQYDELSLVASGEAALTPIFLELQRTLRSREREGSRVRVDTVQITACSVTALDKRSGFQALCSWQAAGRVGHWGHFHDRTNAYDASFDVEPIDGTWKITRLDLHGRERKPDTPQPTLRQQE